MVDPFLYYRNGIMMVIHTDDCIIAGKDSSQIESTIKGIAAKFEIADEGEVYEYLGVKVECREMGVSSCCNHF